MKGLSIGNFSLYGNSNTALHRHWALEKICYVDKIDAIIEYNLINRIINKLFKYGIKISFIGVKSHNEQMIQKFQIENYNFVWIDKGLSIKKETLKKIKTLQPDCKIIGYSPDEMTKIHNQSKDFLESLPYYDYYITTKSYAVDDLKLLGAKKVLFVNNAYEPKFHHPYKITDANIHRFGGDVGFIGMWEIERAQSIIFLANNGIKVRVWGGGAWLQYKGKIENLCIEEGALFSDDYPKSLSSFKINLCFLRKMNNDLQTTRTMEIPACGGFMLAERTLEHQKLFEEGKEADFFDTNEELLEKVKFYLENNKLRKVIAKNGLKRCHNSDYSNYGTIKNIIKFILNA